MHINKTKRSIVATTLSVILAVLFGGLFTQSVRAVVSNPTPVCVGSLCTLTFEPAGDYYLWSPPPGAKNITFDLLGAQGGRSGGQGGRVTGSLTSVPAAIYIYVGGSGLQGAGAAGGFNGGGNAGTGRGDEGSGGGATDIRLTNSINDRIAVAGGGGGSGGFSGGSGGAAGGANASAGTSGQGQGGSGATQSSGGNGGYPNGGSWGSAGELGIGGAGGSSYVSGGGGGGGGYYGGGGGGADIDTCCSNAGGGGGGSSWNHSSQTSNVTHTAGYRAGAGLAVISYSTPPKVLAFAAATTLTNSSSVSYSLLFNESVTGLANSDFSLVDSTATCASIAVTGSGSNYSLLASGCSVGTLKISLNSYSVSGALSGPAVATSAASEVLIERTSPTATASSPSSPNSSATLQYGLEFSEAVTGLSADDFQVVGSGCDVGLVSGSGSSYTVQVASCQNSAEVSLSLVPNSVADLAGNQGPGQSPIYATVLIDRTAPGMVWQRPVSATTSADPTFSFSFLEPVTGIEVQDFIMIGDATGCEFTVSQTSPGLEYQIDSAGCSYGSVQLLLQANSFQDEIGNSGPAAVSASSVISRVAQAAAAPAQTPAPTQSPAPTLSPAPTQLAPESQSSEVVAPDAIAPDVTTPENTVSEPVVILETQAVRKTYSFASVPQANEQFPEIIVAEPQSNNAQITLQNPTAPVAIATQDYAKDLPLLATGLLSSVLAGVGIIKLARQARGKRLVKRFS